MRKFAGFVLCAMLGIASTIAFNAITGNTYDAGLEKGKQTAVNGYKAEKPNVINVVTVDNGEAIVDKWDWVKVVNETPVEQPYGNRQIRYGEECSIGRGGRLKAKGASGDQLLVEYSTTGPEIGSRCPSGVIFFIKRDEFDGMTARYNDSAKFEKMERDTVKAILATSR